MADDLGYGDVPWNNEFLRTKMPNLLQFREQGMVIDKHYTYPSCSPSRAALMTGFNAEKLGLAHYVLNNCANKAPSEKFIPEYMKENGYATYHVGKWHLGFCSWAHTATRRGFDRSYGGLGGGIKYERVFLTVLS